MTQAAPSVVIERLVPAPPRVVFDAWLDPRALQRFMCAGPGVTVTSAQSDPRVGGKFLIVMHVGGQDLEHSGEYLEIEPHRRLSFTWLSIYAGEGSRVTLQFAEAENGRTRLTLEHVGLAEIHRDKHHDGWSHILTELSTLTQKS
jgi:uncharacterized protein YndB with AHSA1/START domain